MVASGAVRALLPILLLAAVGATAPAPKGEDLRSRAMRIHKSAIVVDTHEDVPEQVKSELTFHYVKEVDEVFHHALEPKVQQTLVGETRELVPSD